MVDHVRSAAGVKRYGRPIGAPITARARMGVRELRAENRANNAIQRVADRLPPRSAGFTEEHWQTSYEAHRTGVPGENRWETLAEYKARITEQARRRGLVRDGANGFWYAPDDPHHRRPLGPSGDSAAVQRPRTEVHHLSASAAERHDMQRSEATSLTGRRRHRTARGMLARSGLRPVGTATGIQRGAKVRSGPRQTAGEQRQRIEAEVKAIRGGNNLRMYAQAHGVPVRALDTDAELRRKILAALVR